MHFIPSLSDAQSAWLCARHYFSLSLLARGKSSGVWLVEKEKKKFAAKCEHSQSTRTQMLEREALQLEMANGLGIGPRLMEADAGARVLVMEYVEGQTLRDFIMQCEKKMPLKKALSDLFAQARRLDGAGLDHGQLGGKLTNVLVRPTGKVCVIDFEKASYVRKTHNVAHLRQALFSGTTPLSRRVVELLRDDATFKDVIRAQSRPHA
jgi:putative serine/threonine protein kinase